MPIRYLDSIFSKKIDENSSNSYTAIGLKMYAT